MSVDFSDARMTFAYDETSFQRNVELAGRTYDAILFVVMTTFPDASKDYAQKTLVLESLKSMNYKLSLRYLEEI